MSDKSVPCPYCGARAPLVSGLTIYPHRRDLWQRKFYRCEPCDALVGCHQAARPDGRGGVGDGTVPMGQLANAQLRAARQAAHAAFDPLWCTRRMRRRDAYGWLARQLRIPVAQCHIGGFDLAQCAKVVEAVASLETP